MYWTKNKLNELAYRIVGCAIEVHRELGPGLLESIYEDCLVEELRLQGIECQQQVYLPVFYKGTQVPRKLRVDILVEEIIIIEVKAKELLLPIDKAQILSYLKISAKPKGLLFNFNVVNISREGYQPFVSEAFRELPDD